VRFTIVICDMMRKSALNVKSCLCLKLCALEQDFSWGAFVCFDIA
jgi:hypothetical protein